MGFQSIIHYSIDFTLAAMVLAAIRHNTGLVFAYEDYDVGNYIRKYLMWGEWCYGQVVAYVKGSKRFRKQLPHDELTGHPRIQEIN
ncbi:hypothetical protein Kpol_1057p8 [Vanderwaltozyma polyspora DSM 70294]|uniref:Uncharacterized protein n=1 Tax=Vanderwaltozyma polyspora (strain ATCC 22028 / DSM 70294 / BCRC 21397 / CBS 2163 / NBRC 10782 / NRRL Y-8283 / UCD 57-17) TaxID=436907 RepID=A7TPH6_VANPO|nr:uncharacterized protein Kpol_1057p8 [Vanderwaltozyma polyspora DSM 70294]EDO15820.1 hypothetical protein Kpol_1057p8 [Vanderwaltozyma polyspora DSM 70294]